jgi:hypothetical protein
MISAASLDKVNPRGSGPREALMTGRSEYIGCLIGDAYDFSFGYRAVASGPSLKEQVDLGGTAATKAGGIGDEAYISRTDTSVLVGARFGKNEIIVRNDSQKNTDAKVRIDDDTMMAIAKEFGKNVPDDLAAQLRPVELGKGCPAADSSEVAAVIGPVAVARGGPHDGYTTCDYLGKGGSTIGLSRSKASNASDFLGNNPEAKPIDIDGAVKAEAIESSEGYEVELTIQPTKGEIAFVNTSRGINTPDDKAERKVTKKGALALATTFLDGT